MTETPTRARRLRWIAYILLLITLALPFARCSSAPPATITKPSGETEIVAPEPPPPEPWHRALVGTLGAGSQHYDYTYGYEVFAEAWSVPKDWDARLLVPGRMFHLWPLGAMLLFRWARVRSTRIGLYLAECVLALGSGWWVWFSAFFATPLSGFYVAMAALLLYLAAAAADLVREIRGWRRVEKGINCQVS